MFPMGVADMNTTVGDETNPCIALENHSIQVKFAYVFSILHVNRVIYRNSMNYN